MSQEVQIAHDVAKDTSVFLPVAGAVLTTIGVFMAGLVPWLQYRDNKSKEKQAEKEALEEEARKKAPKYVEQDDFENYKKENKTNFDNLENTVKRTAAEVKDASDSIQSVAIELRNNQESHAKELRETLATFKVGVDSSLSLVYQEVNKAQINVATFNGRLNALELDKKEAS